MSEQELVTILHVDDNEVNRYIVARMLRNAGFEVKEAATGKAGLVMVQEQEPGLIILDVQLPDINGFEVCRRIKANPATSSIPVLHLSANFVKSEDKVQGLESGADGYLVQPVEPIELLATVNALLRIRQAEESALALAREWQTTFDAISDAVCLLDWEGRVLRCNSAMTKLLRKPFSEINGQFHQELMQPMLGSITVRPFTRVQEIHRRESMELQFGNRWFSVTTDPVFDREGAFTGAVYIVADITDRKWAVEQIKVSLQENAELQRLNLLKDDFLSTVSHELRTPMANMKMSIKMLNLSLTNIDERSQKYMQILQSECAREIELINDLLDLQRLETLSYPILIAEIVDLKEWLPSIIEPFQVRAQQRQQILRLKIPEHLPSLVTDRASLSRILTELLNNACKYTSADGEIVFSVHRDSSLSSTIFTISNSLEIPAAELPRIFEKFYRVPNGDRWKQGGTGLGLALVQKLVEHLQGTIHVESGGGWTTFTVQLPNPPRAS